MEYEWRTGSCRECSSWMYDIRHESLRFTPENDYPVQLFTDNIINNKLKPIVVKKSYIEKQINQLIQYLKDSKITIGEAKVFLRFTGIHTARSCLSYLFSVVKYFRATLFFLTLSC